MIVTFYVYVTYLLCIKYIRVNCTRGLISDVCNRAKECTERKVKELLKDQELLQNKVRQTQGERTRICNILDGKCREITELQKEIERLKDDAKMKEIKLKWSQSKLKTEMDLQKDTQQKLDKALVKYKCGMKSRQVF